MNLSSRVERDEAGFTLVELLVAMVIIAIVAVGLLTSITSLTLVTRHHRGIGDTDAAVRAWGEAIKKKAIIASAYTECPAWSPDLDPSFSFPAATAMASTPTIEYWVPTSASDPRVGTFTTQSACETWYAQACGSTVQSACDPGAQRVTLVVKTTDASATGGQTTTQLILRRGNTT